MRSENSGLRFLDDCPFIMFHNMEGFPPCFPFRLSFPFLLSFTEWLVNMQAYKKYFSTLFI